MESRWIRSDWPSRYCLVEILLLSELCLDILKFNVYKNNKIIQSRWLNYSAYSLLSCCNRWICDFETTWFVRGSQSSPVSGSWKRPSSTSTFRRAFFCFGLLSKKRRSSLCSGFSRTGCPWSRKGFIWNSLNSFNFESTACATL